MSKLPLTILHMSFKTEKNKITALKTCKYKILGPKCFPFPGILTCLTGGEHSIG
jgi:hypothetical protein